MCAGLSFHIDHINSHELDRFMTGQELLDARKGDHLQVFFWQKKPFLAIDEDDGVHLYEWGNREKNLKLPKTGWARLESIRDGMWDWLSPKVVRVPADFGYEKKKWFRTPQGVKAVKIRYNNIIRVYLLTMKADQEYLQYTGHDRMPMGKIVYLK